ncbi:MAG: metallophosphoesterase [Alphaproteobacteria bacterium]|nr:metallophosphoesterase [Alphaproteobacteria bacterium]
MIDDKKPLLVFGGPYSNLQAASAMRAEAEARGIPSTNVICTGDVVAYAAAPEATTELVRDWGIAVVAGNCEEQLAQSAEDCGCGFEEGSACEQLSRGWYPFALSNTSPASRAWMATLPPRRDIVYLGARMCVLHGGARQNNRFLFASETEKLEAEFAAADADGRCDIVVAGHAGIPFISSLSHGTWINAGVIGMPANDGTADGWYALLHGKAGDIRIELLRLPFDNVTAAAEMRRSGHANGYARTLITGIWPSHDVLPPREREATGTPLAETAVRYQLAAAI